MFTNIAATLPYGDRFIAESVPGMTSLRVLIVETSPRVRRLLQQLFSLERTFTSVSAAATSAEALAQARTLSPDVILLDVDQPGDDSVATITRLRLLVPRCAVVVHSFRDDLHLRQRLLDAGAQAFVSKQLLDDPLLAAVKAAALKEAV